MYVILQICTDVCHSYFSSLYETLVTPPYGVVIIAHRILNSY